MPQQSKPAFFMFRGQSQVKRYEKLFTIAMLFFTTDALASLLFTSSYGNSASNPYELALQVVFYCGAFWFIAIHWRTVVKGVLKVKWIICLTLIAVASTAWSAEPSFTLRRSIVLFATTAFGIYFGSRFTVPQQLRLLASTFTLVIVFSFVIALVFPGHGIDHFYHPGDWQGAFSQKNTLAKNMVLAILVFYFVRPSTRRRIRWAGIAGALVLLALSRSVTGGLVFCTILGTLLLLRLLRSKITVTIPVLTAVILAIGGTILILTFWGSEILQLLNRDPSLTGRTDLWNAVMIAILKRPWLGYGFKGFWQGMNGQSASVLLTVRWLVPHAHNGFLDLMLDLGLLGVFIFAAGYFALWRRAVRLVKRMPAPIALWPCAYLVFMFLYNLTESSILKENNIFWVLYVATAVSLCLNVSQKPPMLQVAPDLEQHRRAHFAEKTEAASLVKS
jgi:exopolysaccharide production protein ExoQ